MAILRKRAETPDISPKPLALVVDDELEIGKFLADALDEMGFEACTVGTCAEALASSQKHGAFTVAFIDLALPDGSGLELISELRSLQPGLPIVIASGYASMAVLDRDEYNRAPPVLSKPYESKDVADILIGLGITIPYAPN